MLGDSQWYKSVDELSGRVTRSIGLAASSGLVLGSFERIESLLQGYPDLVVVIVKYGTIFGLLPLLALTWFQLQAASVLFEDSSRSYFSLGKDKDGKDVVWGPHFIMLVIMQILFMVSLLTITFVIRNVSAP